jgi:hypothetical protein
MEVWWNPDYTRLTPGECYFPPALLENPAWELPEYYQWVLRGLKIAAAHQEDPARTEIIRELEAIADDPNLTWLKEEKQ